MEKSTKKVRKVRNFLTIFIFFFFFFLKSKIFNKILQKIRETKKLGQKREVS